jgi:4-amino-4-deoxy-L-arabinose transferase-like glycosyltransferase
VAGKLAPERVAYGFAALAGLIVLWNAIAYPSGAGYDAASHKEYADFLVDHHRLPFRNETPEYYSPPLYYAVAGIAASLGRAIGLGDPFKVTQLLNVPAVVGTVLLTVALARMLWPERRWLPVYAAGFVALNPTLARVGSMVNPEPTDLFVSMLCLTLAARIFLGRGSRMRNAVGLGVALGCGEMIRQFSLWTLAVVVLAFLAALVRQRALLAPLAVALAVCVAVAAPWYVYRTQNYGNPVFDRPQAAKPLWERRPASFYVDPGLPDVFTQPYRPHLVNRAWPQTYSDLWGDWYGVFAWSSTHERPSAARNAWLLFQNVLGLVPTGLAVGGWLVLLARTLRRLDAPRLLVSLLPLAGIAGYLYFTVSFPTHDGDVLKPMYLLTTLGAWALCFGWAAERLPRLRWAFVAIALLDLPFVLYKGGVGWF